MNVPRRRRLPRKGREAGFSLIEVMIAILIMGIGLLGYAMLQTMSVRFTQSANYRTQATDLTYEMLDQIRSNRVNGASYAGSYAATTADCAPAFNTTVSTADYIKDWSCRMGKALGGTATAKVVASGNDVTVSVSWGDERWNADAGDTTFSAKTTL